MKIIRGTVAPKMAGCVATIGNFDGLHLGHQALVNKLTNTAKKLGVPAVVVTFVPNPKSYFSPTPVVPLMRFSEKCRRLKAMGVHVLWCLPFNQRTKEMASDIFLETCLEPMQCRYVLVGDDFRFGHNRLGHIAQLRQWGHANHCEVETYPPVGLDGERMSSTLVRSLLELGDMSGMSRHYGRPFGFKGRVIHGAQRGRLLGFPTANIKPPCIQLPPNGVYVVEIEIDKQKHKGVANLGVRPTVDGQTKLCEVHLFDFSQDIYGAIVDIRFLQKIRHEERFESLERLREQIEDDVLVAKQYLDTHNPESSAVKGILEAFSQRHL